MSMGNYFSGKHVQTDMATKQRRTGIDHLTVVPENYDPPEAASEDDAETAADDDRVA